VNKGNKGATEVKYGILAYPGIAYFPSPPLCFDFSPNERLIVAPIEETLLALSKHQATRRRFSDLSVAEFKPLFFSGGLG
jgi:hypothetical protein